MAEFLSLKKSNCKNCYKCIRHCPVKSIRFSGNQAHIVGNECILCGQCFVVCPQDAKQIVDSTEKARVLIQSGAPVYASLAPAFAANYEGIGIRGMRRALQALGFADAEETAIGATLVKTEYNRLLREEQRDILISSCCHSANLLIQKYFPQELPCLANVLSPMLAHGQDIKRRHPEARTVFIGPCVAKKDEAEYYAGPIDAVLTFEELSAWMAREGVIPERDAEVTPESRARLFPIAGGIIDTMGEKVPGYTYLTVDGVENCIAALEDIRRGSIHRCFIEMSACSGSCIGGPVMEKFHRSPVRDYMAVSGYAGRADFAVSPTEPEELHKEMTFIGRKLPMPEEAQIAEALRQMGKTRKEDELNCGSCGYDTCREKAIAIIQGKADLTMCLPFLKDKAETLSGTIVDNSPNALMVLNEQLEVQQINPAALSLFNLKHESDVLGEPVIRMMDPTVFIQVLDGGRNVRARREYLADYRRYVEETVVYDRAYHLIICLMRDVTQEEEERQSRERFTRKTAETADQVVAKQMRIVQEIASLLGETAAETKIALTQLKESLSDE